MRIETVDPGVDGVRESVRHYVEKYPEFAGALELRGKIMELQQGALELVDCPLQPLADEVVEAKLTLGDTLLEPGDLPLDGPLFRDLVAGICRAVGDAREERLPFCGKLVEWEGLSDEMLTGTRDLVLAGENAGFSAEASLSKEEETLVNSVLWEGLVPFYRSCGRILSINIGQSFWQRARCPVCGAAPLMGKYREEDGLWVVECSLCHTGWNLLRTSCPFCDESVGSLRYIYIEGDVSHRANYCEACRRYIKTVDLRDGEGLILLPLEDIVTIDVDEAAKSEGLIPASAA